MGAVLVPTQAGRKLDEGRGRRAARMKAAEDMCVSKKGSGATDACTVSELWGRK